MITKPELLACRAVHQYRRRDILAYVSLRLFLKNSATIRDIWIDKLLVEKIIDRDKVSYNEAKNFKERDHETGEFEYRILHLPAPSEILAETSLLAECSKLSYFKCREYVYSYHLSSEPSENHGLFTPYFIGFLERHRAIAVACRNSHDSQVAYLDIKKFYPSITLDQARDTWIDASKKSGLNQRYRDLGCVLIDSYRKLVIDGKPNERLLTGPMFCHLLADLFLRSMDESMSQKYPKKYFRYVDDVAIVVGEAEMSSAIGDLRENIERLGLELNRKKDIKVSSRRWLGAEHDFEYEKESSISWKTFIGSMKIILLRDPDNLNVIRNLFRQNGIRISPLDYSEISQERPWLVRIKGFKSWIKGKSKKTNVDSILHQAQVLRKRYTSDFFELIDNFDDLDDFDRKRKTYRLKYLVTRLLYIAEEDVLQEIADHLSGLSEMLMAAEIYRAVATQNVTRLLKFGPHAAQSAAQAIKAFSMNVKCDSVDWSQPQICQAYAVLCLNGLNIDSSSEPPLLPMIKFCDWTNTSQSLYREPDAYFRELGCLHGIDSKDLNTWVLNTAFDRDDDMVFDMQSIMNESY